MAIQEQGLGPEPATEGLRQRKKRRTRLAIKEAAVELFSERGYDATTVEDIAGRADVSVTTFFRYFDSKEEVVFSDDADRLPAARRVIVAQPRSTSDLDAVRIALREGLKVGDDPSRLAQQSRAMTSSYALMGRGLKVISEYQNMISDALAERRGLAAPDDACRLTAAVAMTALAQAWAVWERGGLEDLDQSIDETFALLGSVVRSPRATPRTQPTKT